MTWVALVIALLVTALVMFARARSLRRAKDAAAGDAAAKVAAGVALQDRITADLGLRTLDGHLADGTPCWTFVTGGLAMLDHPELVMSVIRDGDDPAAVREHALMVLRSLYLGVLRGGRFAPWTSGELGGGNFGRDDLRGFVLVPAIGPDDVALPAGALTILMATTDEAKVARGHGAASVSSLLGHHYRHYPTAWWLDPARPSLARDLGPSAVGGAALPLSGMSTLLAVRGAVAVEPDADVPGLATGTVQHFHPLVITVDDAAADQLAPSLRALQPGQATLVATAPSPHADGRLVWVPGRARSAITGLDGGTAVTGSFVAFTLADRDLGAGVVEDGFVISLDRDGRDALVAALAKGADLDGPAAVGERRWRLEHLDSRAN